MTHILVRNCMESHKVIFDVLYRCRKGTLIIDSSTIDPNASKELIDKAGTCGVRMVDAPVSGGVGGESQRPLGD
jgi:3-hydroxyisobutyrate dehydrogenase